MSQNSIPLRKDISEIYTQRDIIQDRRNLLKNANMLATFLSYGIPRDLLETFIIGLDVNGDIVLPVSDPQGEILGKLYIKNFEYNGGTYICKARGLVGLTMAENKKVTICKNIVDLLIAYKMNFDNPIIIPDRINPPHHFKAYQEYYFMDSEDSLIDMAPGITFTYDIPSLYHHVIDRKEIPSPRQVISGDTEAYVQKTNPAIIEGKFWWLIKKMNYAVSSDGKRHITLPNKYVGRRVTTKKGVYYMTTTPADMPKSFVRKKYTDKEVFDTVVQTLMDTAFFFSEAQCRVIALYLMYQYVYPVLGFQTHLAVIFTSEREMKYFHRMMKLICPSNQSFYSKGTASASWTNPNITTFDAPPLVYTEHITNPLCNRGIPLLIDKMLNPNMRSVSSIPLEPVLTDLKNLLYNYSMSFDPKPRELNMRSNMIDKVLPLYVVADRIPMARDDFNALFRLTVRRSASLLPRYNMNNLRSAGIYANEQVFEELNEPSNKPSTSTERSKKNNPKNQGTEKEDNVSDSDEEES